MTHTVRPPELHSSATLPWSGPRAEEDSLSTPEGDFVQPPHGRPWLMPAGETVPERVEHRSEDPWYDGTGPSRAVAVVPPGVETRRRWRDTRDSIYHTLAPILVPRMPEGPFDLDPAPVHSPVHLAVPYDDPSSREAFAESLANVLIAQMTGADGPAADGFARRPRGRLPRPALRAVEAFIDAHLDQNFALADLAAVAYLSEFHFARQFKQTTGLPPHQFVIRRRVERAKRLIDARRLPLAQIAAAAGFSDQSHLTRLFKRVVGITPGRFTPNRFA